MQRQRNKTIGNTVLRGVPGPRISDRTNDIRSPRISSGAGRPAWPRSESMHESGDQRIVSVRDSLLRATHAECIQGPCCNGDQLFQFTDTSRRVFLGPTESVSLLTRTARSHHCRSAIRDRYLRELPGWSRAWLVPPAVEESNRIARAPVVFSCSAPVRTRRLHRSPRKLHRSRADSPERVNSKRR